MITEEEEDDELLSDSRGGGGAAGTKCLGLHSVTLELWHAHVLPEL